MNNADRCLFCNTIVPEGIMVCKNCGSFKLTKQNKFKNIKIEVDGICFDSKKEARRYMELKLLLKAKKIRNLEMQKEFILIPANRGINRSERKCSYYADFYYYDCELKRYVCEDVKGVRTKEYIIKRKLMLDKFGISVSEV